jgi:hypothetical protein
MNQRLLATSAWVAALLLNPWVLGKLLAPDGRIGSAERLGAIVAFEVALVALGWVLFLRWPGRPGRSLVHGGAVLLLACVVGIGAASRQPKAPAPATSAKRAAKGPLDPAVFLWEMPEICAWLTGSAEVHVGKEAVPDAEADLARARAKGNTEDILRAQKALGLLYLGHSRPDDAIAELERALAFAEETKQPAKRVSDLEFCLGLAHLRRGEVDHCIEHHNPERCLFPIRGSGVWTDTAGALAAMDHFAACYRLDPKNTGARWLFTIAHQAAGEDAEGVPTDLLLPAPPPDAEANVGRFRDLAPALGVDVFDGAGGAVLDDLDGDGWLDILTSSIFPCEPLHFFHNQGDGTFEDWSERSRLSAQMGGLSISPADYDDDGRLDLFVPRGAWMSDEYGRQRRSLIHQMEGCVFEDTTRQAGLGERAFPCQAAGWGDYDNDGDLDLYIGNERHPCELFRNRGDGRFEDVTSAAGVANGGMTKGLAWGDYDNDGDLDLHVSNLGQPNLLYQNQGDGTFRDVARELGIAVGDTPEDAPGGNKAFTTWWWDYDNDGWLDLFVAGFSGSLTDWADDYAGNHALGNRLHLYRNDGRGGFRDVAKEMGIHRIFLPMGANYGDIDNDGYLDFYLGTGKPDFEFLVPNVMFRNVAAKRFADVTTEAGVGHLQKGHGIAFGDVDNDGDQDILAQMGAFYLADAFHDAFFENPGNSNHWVTLLLRGDRSNHFGIGARIRVDVTTPAGPRSIHVVCGLGGSFGASSVQQEIGLGDAVSIERIEVFWPVTDTRQVFEGLELDRFYEIHEGDPVPRALERRAIALAGRPG